MAKTRSVLASKRTTGPTANATMIVNLRQTKCDYRDPDGVRCTKFPLLVKNLPGGRTQRLCAEHIHPQPVYQQTRNFNVDTFLKSLGWK